MRNRSAAAHPHRILRAMATLSSHAHARVGLLGNPSDIYGGKGLGFAVAELRATVTLAVHSSAWRTARPPLTQREHQD